MKKLNKYLLLLAAAVFTFTACENGTEREPSPAGNPNAIAFKQSKVEAEINPGKAALEYKLTVVRTSADSAVTAAIQVVEGDIDIINVPASVSFAKGELEAELLLTFPNAEIDSTYTITVAIDSLSQSPYLSGSATCTFTAIIAAWENAAKPAVFVDAVVSSPYGVTPLPFYVNFKEKVNADGTLDFRFLNPYRNFDEEAEADDFGVFSVFPYNEEADVDMEADYHWEIHVDVDGKATFGKVALGINYGDGAINAWMAADFWAQRNGTDPDYDTYGAGIYDATAKTITLPAGVMLWYLDGYGGNYTSLPHIIYLDSKQYQDDHLSIADYNAEDIEWIEQESVVNQFESTIFNFTNEEQKLFKAKDQYEGNAKSPFINLFCLKDVYAKGGNLAFYWDGEDGEIEIPVEQDTKISFMGQELLIADAEGEVATVTVKGTDVKVFTFELTIVSDKGNEVGTFIETFSMAEEAVIFEKSDFVGDFVMAGYSPFNGAADARAIEIQEVEGKLVILGFEDCDTIKTSFDAETGVLSIAPQVLPNKITYNGTDYDATLYTMDAGGNVSTTAAIDLAFKLDGNAHITATSEAIGFLVRISLGWWDGIADFTLIPAAAAPAPAKAPAINGVRELKQGGFKSVNTPSVEHLSFKGKYQRKVKTTVAF